MSRIVIWDIDGTLLDTHPGVERVLCRTLEEYHLPSEKALIKRIVNSPKLPDALEVYMGVDKETSMLITNTFRSYYGQEGIYDAYLYKGVRAVLDALHDSGVKQAIASYKRHDLAVAICRNSGLDDYCSPIVGADMHNKMSKTDLIRRSMESLTNSVESVFYIGDMPTDKEAAEELGIQFCGVNYGYGFSGVEGYADSPEQILNIIK